MKSATKKPMLQNGLRIAVFLMLMLFTGAAFFIALPAFAEEEAYTAKPKFITDLQQSQGSPAETELQTETTIQPDLAERTEPDKDTQTQPVFDLGEKIVTGSRIPTILKDAPGTISVIKREQIEASKARDIAELLDQVTGVRILNNGFMGQLSTIQIRGSFSPQVLILVDGRPINPPNLGTVDLTGIPINNLERVEIVRGPFSATYGSNAMSGVVNLITRKTLGKKNLKLQGAWGEFDTWNHEGTISLSPSWGNFIATYNFKETNGARENSHYFDGNLFGTLSGKWNNGEWMISGGSRRNGSGNPGPMPAANPLLRTANQTNIGTDEISSRFDWTVNDDKFINSSVSAGPFELQLYRNSFKPRFHTRYVDLFTLAHQHQDTRLLTTMLGGELKYKQNFGKEHTVVAGAAYEQDRFSYDSEVLNTASGIFTPTNFKAQRNTLSFFGEDVFKGKDFQINLGIRWDNPSNYQSQLSPRISYLHNIDQLNRFRASFGRGFRAPTLNDLFWPQDPFAKGNPNLIPEKSTSYELGFESLLTPSLLTRLTYFQEWTKDLIAWAPTDPTGPFGPRWQPSNLNAMSKRGLELELLGQITNEWSFATHYTFINAKQTNNELARDADPFGFGGPPNPNPVFEKRTRRAANIPAHVFSWNLTYQGKGWNSSIFGEFNDKAFQYYSDFSSWPRITRNTKTLPSFALLHFKAAKSLGKGNEVYFLAKNIFNQEYAMTFGSDIYDRNFPMPGRNFMIGFTQEL